MSGDLSHKKRAETDFCWPLPPPGRTSSAPPAVGLDDFLPEERYPHLLSGAHIPNLDTISRAEYIRDCSWTKRDRKES